ncbi:hypothetical protein [Prochlorococcus marinus]|uniref:hypothetical protein n=1 Tax=Prochlorococcus marinus TaxID=1219 RepID=UPI001ADA15EA|nr:hypothetical protein [Prochlorococcus marinus]MBO8217148.1 hypothetical protein [Prochlorococcus marinus XMU1405]MBW3040373.1 hypothetical protein [Prochlorococcus marinus str. MU1405]MBW3047831.1 hypothetical protein [Prochlorococcus marinus str. MU1406]
MPTKKKRVGFIPREDVMRIIDKLSIENNLSNSKIISILVEEALSIRGIFNKNNGKATPSFQLPKSHPQILTDNSANFIDKSEPQIDTKLVNHLNPGDYTQLNEVNNEAFDLNTYKKFLSFLKFQEMTEKYDT